MAIQDLFHYTGPVADAVLLAVLVIKGRWKSFPTLAALILFDLFAAFISIHLLGRAAGFEAYAALDGVSTLLQLSLVLQLLSRVLPKNSRLAARGRRIFLIASAGGLVATVAATFLFHPSLLSPIFLIQMRLDIFTGLITCEAVVAIMLAANRVGLGWRNHVLAVGQGLMLWALSGVVTEVIVCYVHAQGSLSEALYYIRVISYLVTLAYWSVSLWREEPVRRPISPEMRKYIVALHDQVTYDLGRTGN